MEWKNSPLLMMVPKVQPNLICSGAAVSGTFVFLRRMGHHLLFCL